MKNKVLNFIKNNNLIDNEPIICAVSGGVDSICLLDILYCLGFKLVLAHVNHHKRKESEIEEKAMRNLALKLNIPFELLDYHYDTNDNFHNDSHNKRYEFFKSLCDKYNTNTIATAHHLDDQIETILIKLMEGSNLYGYGGISICNDDGKYRIIRPLLCCNKKELYDYASTNKLTYFEDASNNEDYFLRNRLRHNVIPLLNNECSDLYNKVYQYSNLLKESFDYIRASSIDYLNKSNNIIDLNSFNELHIALKKDIISLLLEEFNIRKNNNLINDILVFLSNSDGNKMLNLERHYLLIKSYDKAYIRCDRINDLNELEININDVVIYGNRFKFYFSKKRPLNNAKYIKLCYNVLELPLKIRSKKDGDIIKLPIGNKKVSRVFIDYKISLDNRNQTPIILDNSNNILWVYDLVKSNDVINQKENGDIYLVCEEK